MKKKKKVEVYDNLYCVIDGYLTSPLGEYPKMVYLPGIKLATKYTALSYLMTDLEFYLKENGYEEILLLLKELKKEADDLIAESEARND
jgi:hypothetical protein